jgi:3-phenylpropionate/trans-cinnamate dioxygenase ferredoxin component
MSASWTSIISADQLPSGHYKVVTINCISIVIGNSNGKYFALENLCTHDGGELSGGEIEGEEFICPRHGAGFCIKTGVVTRPPAYENIRRFPVRIQGSDIQIQINNE